VAGHGNKCVEIRKALLRLFGKADVVDLVMRHYYGACGWDTARLDAAINCVQYGPKAGDVIAAGDSDGRIHFICAQTGEKIVCPLSGHSDDVNSVAWSPDGTKLASGSDDQTVRIWEAATGKQLRQLKVDSSVGSIAYSPDGSKLAAAHSTKVSIFNVETGEVQCTVRGHCKDNEECTCKHGQYPCDYEANPDCPVTGHQRRVSSVHFSPDGKRLVSGSWDNTVIVWDPSTGEQLRQLNVDAGHFGVLSVSFSPKGDMVAAGCYNGNIFFVDAAAGQIKSSVRCDSQVQSVACSADGTKLAAGLGYPKPSVVVFNTQTNEQICSLRGHRYAPSLSKECFLSLG